MRQIKLLGSLFLTAVVAISQPVLSQGSHVDELGVWIVPQPAPYESRGVDIPISFQNIEERVEVLWADLKSLSSKGHDNYFFRVGLRNRTNFETVGYSLEFRVETLGGLVRGGGSVPLGRLQSYEEGHFEMMQDLGQLHIDDGDSVIVRLVKNFGEEDLLGALEEEAPNTSHGLVSIVQEVGIAGTFCSNCGDRAELLCINGVKSFNCVCNETSASCVFECFPPPI